MDFSNMNILDWISFILGIGGAICIAIYTIPLLIRVIRTKDSSIVSAPMYSLLCTGDLLFIVQCLISLINAINGNSVNTWLGTMFPIFIANIINVVSGLITLSIKWINCFRAKKANMTEQQYCAKLRKEKEAKNKKSK